MKFNRLSSGLLIAVAGALTAASTVYLMQPLAQEETTSFYVSAAAQHSGTVDANPFGKGASMSLPASHAQSAAESTSIFRVNEKGELILDQDTKVRLDILLSELSRNATRHELEAVEASALNGLPKHAAQKASRIFDGYMKYFKSESELNVGSTNESAVSPAAMLDKLVGLRRQYLGAEVADAMFAVQEVDERFGVQVAMMDADPKLTAQEKLARIDALQRALPADAATLNAELEASRSALMIEQNVTALRQQGASEAQIRQLRERHVGTEAAKSIGEMERQKMDWERRQQTFIQQKSVIAQMALTERQKQERVEALLSQLYSEEEIPAARAYHQAQGSTVKLN